MSNFDTIIVGAGIGGLIAGALLAAEDRRKVLVLEKESEVGGRVLSFGGPHGKFTADEYQNLLLNASGVRIIQTDPPLKEIVDKHKIFEKFIIDSGWHTVGGCNRNRFSTLAERYGKSVKVAGQKGFFYLRNDKWCDLKDYTADWPAESKREQKRLAKERLLLSSDDSLRYDHVDMKHYLDSLTQDENVKSYYKMIARFVLALNDELEGSAGEFIRTNNMPIAAGGHLSHGGGNGEVVGGWKNAANAFVEIIREHGGEVRTGAFVREVVIKGNKATGVVVGRPNEVPETLAADTIIVDRPMDSVGQLVPLDTFPLELQNRIKGIYSALGMTGIICIKELLESDSPLGVYLSDPMPGEPFQMKGWTDWIAYEQTTALDPTRRLPGTNEHYIQTWTLVHPNGEADNDELLRKIADKQMAFFRSRYPNWDDIYVWSIFHQAQRIYGMAPAPGLIGDRRPPVQHPCIANLFFTGDQVVQTDVGSNGAAHGAILCANAVSGQDFITFLPEFLR